MEPKDRNTIVTMEENDYYNIFYPMYKQMKSATLQRIIFSFDKPDVYLFPKIKAQVIAAKNILEERKQQRNDLVAELFIVIIILCAVVALIYMLTHKPNK